MIKAIVFDCFGVLGGHSAAGWHRNEPLLSFIRQLKPEYKIGLLSNLGTSSVNSLFPPEEREQLFDATVVAGEAGLVKPQPEIYQLACDKLAVAPAEAVFVDDYQGNIRGATAIGMQSVLYRDVSSFQRDLTNLLQRHA